MKNAKTNAIKDFFIAEYKTIILVLLFCGGIFGWFYYSELQKEEAKKFHPYECMEPGVRLKDYYIGKTAPQFDDSWEQTSELPGLVTWRHQGNDIIINLKDNIIKTIEYYPAEDDLKKCSEDFKYWRKSHSTKSASIISDNKVYTKYTGVVEVAHAGKSDDERNYGWIINSLLEE